MKSINTLSWSLLAFCMSSAVCSAGDNKLETTLFSSSEITPCPAVIAAAPSGEVFVGIDLQGSLGKKPGYGKIMRLVDNDADGKADTWTDFVKVDNPRGIISLGDKLIVLHTTVKNGKYDTQQISEFVDANNDGIADGPGKPLVKNIGNPKYLQSRGADHCTNNIRLGIDGWVYISVGDFGFADAVDADGKKLTLLGGGVVRVRPDGTELETFITGTRNVYDVAIDPFMNIFTRENTNDGVGWWSRASHYIQSGDYGYPSLYTNFPEDMLPSLGEYGKASGVGALYLQEPMWPKEYNNNPLLSDWGHSTVYVHEMHTNGASFKNKIREFQKFAQVTDIDIDASGRLYASAWDGSGYLGKGKKGYIERVVPKGWTYESFPKISSMNEAQLLNLIKSPSITKRTNASYELVERNSTSGVSKLIAIARDTQNSDESRVAALYTLSQISGEKALPALEALSADKVLAEHAIRCMADRLEVAKHANLELLIKYLEHENPRVKVAATVALGRVGDLKAAPAILANALYSKKEALLAAKENPDHLKKEKGYFSPDIKKIHSTPNKRIILPHVSQRALVKMNAEQVIIDALNASKSEEVLAALTVAKFMHSEKIVDALILKAQSSEPSIKQKVANVLMRLHQKETIYDGSTWWTTRPAPEGPYYYPVDWEGTPKIDAFLKAYVEKSADKATVIKELKKNKAYVLPFATRPIPKVSKNKKIKDTSIEDVMHHLVKYKANVKKGAKVIKDVGCANCHNINSTDSIKAPDLTKLGHLANTNIAESILKPGAEIAASWVTLTLNDDSIHLGTIVSEDKKEITLHNIAGIPTKINVADIKKREPGLDMMSLHLCDNLSLNAFGDLVGYIKSLDKSSNKKAGKKKKKKK